ncbi:transposase [Streptomyces virginiae]|uniref:transposase n=1 Tax=Streptomyces virginiae TaxID=1961 RepID=UPI0036935B90
MVHLIRNSMRYASRRDAPEITRDLKPVYTVVDEAQACSRLSECGGKWDSRYPSISGIWTRPWNEFSRRRPRSGRSSTRRMRTRA